MTAYDPDEIVLNAYRSSVYHMRDRMKRFNSINVPDEVAELKQCEKRLARVEAEISAKRARMNGKEVEQRKPKEAGQQAETKAEKWRKLMQMLNYQNQQKA